MTKHILAAIIAITVLVMNSAAFAGQIALTADRTQLSVGESITLSLELQGVGDDPKLSGTDGFDVVESGTSSQIQIINGSFTSSKVYHYKLTAQRTGEFTVGPATVMDGGNRVQSNTITVSVGERSNVQAGITSERNTAISLEISNPEPYVGEQIVCTLRFTSRIPIQNAELTPPQFRGFTKEQLGEVAKTRRVINGEAWDVSEVRWALFPSKSGRITIDPIRIAADVAVQTKRRVDPFFSNPLFGGLQDFERQVFATESATVDVKDLPKDGMPKNFSGLVGSFNMTSKATDLSAKIGDSITITTTVKGTGQARDIPEPTLAETPAYRVYLDQPSFNKEGTSAGIVSAKTSTMAIVPLQEGKIDIAPMELNYFDPIAKSYQTIKSDPITIEVKGGTASFETGKPQSKKGIETISNDLMPISSDIGARNIGDRTSYILLALSPALFIAIATAIRRRSRRISNDPIDIRMKRARREFAKKIKEINDANEKEFCKEASLILRRFLGSISQIDGAALTAREIGVILSNVGCDPKLTEQAIRFIEKCDASIYGGAAINTKEISAMKAELSAIMKGVKL